jgi:hypothetical protein
VGQMSLPSSPEKHGRTICKWEYSYPIIQRVLQTSFSLLPRQTCEMKLIRMTYERSDTCLQQLGMKCISNSRNTAQINELIGQLVSSPSLFTLHWSPLPPLPVTMGTRDRIISPRFNLIKNAGYILIS